MMRMPTLFLFLFLLFHFAAIAEPDIFGTGNGHNGPVTINAANTVVNSYTRLTVNISPGNKAINVASTAGFSTGDLVMVWQWGRTTASADGLGRWEFARITGTTASQLLFAYGITRNFNSQLTQVIRVPEYTSVVVNAGGSLVPKSWDGTTGGILVFLCSGNVTNNGSIIGTGRGFRGGIYVQDQTGATGEIAPNAPTPFGAYKGEGAINDGASAGTGLGNNFTGGGGGVAYLSGGGGGSLAGSGGAGGYSSWMDGSRPVGGSGGTSLSFDPLTQLIMGGGGGAGHGSDVTGGTGGNGGAVIFIRCASMSMGFNNSMRANGSNGTNTANDAAGGGAGAGGAIYLRSTGSITLNTLFFSASGGTGGSASTALTGTGGGGGGGSIYFQGCAGSNTPSISSASGGFAGNQSDVNAPGGQAYGATNGGAGSIAGSNSCMVIPATPAIIYPASGNTTPDKFTISGTAAANSTVLIFIDDLQIASVIADAGGNYSYAMSSALNDGAHDLRIYSGILGNYSVSATIPFISSAVSLPVTWLNFTGRKKGDQVLLQWSTASEQNSSVFEVERSTNGNEYSVIGKLDAAGNPAMEQKYSFTDKLPFTGWNYYRLRQIDLDGKHTYSKIVSVKFDDAIIAGIRPNPVRDELQISFVAPKGPLELKLVNSSGIIVKHQQVMSSGDQQQYVMNMRNLNPGQYILLVGVKKLKVVKL